MGPRKAYKLQRLPLSEQIDDRVRVVFYLGVVLASVIVAAAIGGRVGPAVLVGSVVGLASHWYASRKCATALPRSCDIGAVREAAYSLGYVNIDSKGRHYRIGNLPRLMYFNHQDLVVRELEDTRLLVGPVFTLKIVKGMLER